MATATKPITEKFDPVKHANAQPWGSPITTKKRVTASSVVKRILLSKNVPIDAVIIERVRRESGSEKFNRASLSWYKTHVRKGDLPGMDGQRHIIQQKRAK